MQKAYFYIRENEKIIGIYSLKIREILLQNAASQEMESYLNSLYISILKIGKITLTQDKNLEYTIKCEGNCSLIKGKNFFITSDYTENIEFVDF